MARSNVRTRDQLNTGDTFAVPLPDGRFGACRVLQASTDEQFHRRNVLVAAVAWIGTQPPSLSEPRLRLLLRVTSHDSAGKPLLFWVRQEVPTAFLYLGVVPPTPVEAAMGHMIGHMDWDEFTASIAAQWKWDEEHGLQAAHDEVELRRRQNQAARLHAEKRRDKARTTVLGKKPYRDFEEHHDEDAARLSRKILRAAVARLQELGSDGDDVAKLDVLRLFIERWNEISEGSHCDTIDREIICDVFDHLVWFAGLEDYGTDLEDPPWRDF